MQSIPQTDSDRADNIASVRPAIREVIAALEEREDNSAKLCATFELSADATAWVQFDGEVLNVSLPPGLSARSDFGAALDSVSPWKIGEEEPGKYATFAINASDARKVALAVNAIFVLLAQSGTYEVNISLEWLPSEA
jgi:hypothetical protein